MTMMLGMLLLSLAQPVDDAAASSAAPINIVIVLADDLGYDYLDPRDAIAT